MGVGQRRESDFFCSDGGQSASKGVLTDCVGVERKCFGATLCLTNLRLRSCFRDKYNCTECGSNRGGICQHNRRCYMIECLVVVLMMLYACCMPLPYPSPRRHCCPRLDVHCLTHHQHRLLHLSTMGLGIFMFSLSLPLSHGCVS